MIEHWFPKGSNRFLVVKNTASQLFGRVVSAGAMTLMSILLARKYGAEGYGDFVKITTFVGFFYVFADFGLNAQFVKKPNASWQSLFGLRLAISTILIIVAVGVLSLFPQQSSQGYTSLVRFGILLLSPAILFQAIITTTNAFFQKSLRYDLAAIAQNIGSILMLLVAFVLLVDGRIFGPYVGVVSLLVGSIATSFVALYFLRKKHNSILPLFNSHDMVKNVQQSLPLGITLLCNLIYFHSDSVIMALSRETKEVGIYGFAYKVFELPLVFPIFYMNSIYPVLVRVQSNRKIFWQSFWLLLILSVSIAVTLWILASYIPFVRSDFAASIVPLRILLLSIPIFFESALLMWMMIAQNKQKQLLFIHVVAMIINISLNVLYIPQFGYIAAAWITGISEMFIFVVSFLFVLRNI